MKSTILLASSSVASLAGVLYALTTMPIVANAQLSKIISECTDENKSNCAVTANRTCYNYVLDGTHNCGYCLNGFLEYEGVCYDIEDIDTDRFTLLPSMLEKFLPDYVDPDAVSVEERAQRLKAVAKIISVWNSYVPPTKFSLGLTNETFLTLEERKGRLGILSELVYDENKFLDMVGNRGELGRFEYTFADNNEDSSEEDIVEDEEYEEYDEITGGERFRQLARTGGQRKLQSAVDWEADGYMTVVKNQGVCGCCWAVATAAAVESALMITNQTSRNGDNDQHSLSTQQMISCDDSQLGCAGGNILQAVRYVWEHNDVNNGNFGGLFSAEDWPYSDFKGDTTTDCKAQSLTADGKTQAVYLNYPKVVNTVNDRAGFDERKERLMAAVAKQPAVAVLRSECDLLMNYKEGVLTHDEGCQCCDNSCIDHAIVVVGYDTNAETPYWKVRNSWGSEWGEDGYFRVAMNDAGCGWGLFGLLAESAVPSQAYKNLEDLPERPGWWETAQTWEKALVILFSILGFCCLCGIVGALRRRVKREE